MKPDWRKWVRGGVAWRNPSGSSFPPLSLLPVCGALSKSPAPGPSAMLASEPTDWAENSTDSELERASPVGNSCVGYFSHQGRK